MEIIIGVIEFFALFITQLAFTPYLIIVVLSALIVYELVRERKYKKLTVYGVIYAIVIGSLLITNNSVNDSEIVRNLIIVVLSALIVYELVRERKYKKLIVYGVIYAIVIGSLLITNNSVNNSEIARNENICKNGLSKTENRSGEIEKINSREIEIYEYLYLEAYNKCAIFSIRLNTDTIRNTKSGENFEAFTVISENYDFEIVSQKAQLLIEEDLFTIHVDFEASSPIIKETQHITRTYTMQETENGTWIWAKKK